MTTNNAKSSKSTPQSWQDVDWQRLFTQLTWNADGLIPAIAQQYDSLDVLMQAWMNQKSLQETLLTGQVCYWSRSRQKLWRKGESSGQIQHFKRLRFDCDADCLLLLVDQTGPACHTGRRSCFFYELSGGDVIKTSEPMIDPTQLYPGKKNT